MGSGPPPPKSCCMVSAMDPFFPIMSCMAELLPNRDSMACICSCSSGPISMPKLPMSWDIIWPMSERLLLAALLSQLALCMDSPSISPLVVFHSRCSPSSVPDTVPSTLTVMASLAMAGPLNPMVAAQASTRPLMRSPQMNVVVIPLMVPSSWKPDQANGHYFCKQPDVRSFCQHVQSGLTLNCHLIAAVVF